LSWYWTISKIATRKPKIWKKRLYKM